jgi:hypothetical protein
LQRKFFKNPQNSEFVSRQKIKIVIQHYFNLIYQIELQKRIKREKILLLQLRENSCCQLFRKEAAA